MKHVILNFRQKEEELNETPLSPREKALAEALQLRESFRQLQVDGEYMDILWGSIMENKLRNIHNMLDVRLRLRGEKEGKKGWF